MGITESNEVKVVNYEETIHQQRIPSGQGLIGATPYWVQISTDLLGIQGTNNANGTEILEINIPAGHVFVCSNIWFSCNEGRHIAVCTVDDAQVLGHASQSVNILTLGSDNKGLHALLKEEDPIFIIDNSGSDVDIDMLVFASHTVFNIVNDPVTSYFEAFISGLMYRGNVTTRGIV